MNNNNFFELKKITKEIMNQKTEPSPDEQFFEDDINAINEKDNGKISRKSTHIHTKSAIINNH